jgi:uncharacterized caspase-like protein
VVLIGSSEFADPALMPLPGIRDNLSGLRGFLTSRRGTGIPKEHCVVLAEPPDAATVAETLVEAARAADDLLLLYYATHGLSTTAGELYLGLHNTKPAILTASALGFAAVREIIRDSPARTRVVILDCCLSGRAVQQVMSDADALLGQADVDGAFVLTATQPNQLALAPEDQQYTLFTGELLAVLREGVPGGPELITMDLLYRYLKASLARRNLPTPTCNNSGAAANMALGRNVAYQTSSVSIPRLREQIAELATAESETREVYATAHDKIANIGLPRLGALAPQLVSRLGDLNRLADKGNSKADELARLSRECAEALEGTKRRRAMAAGLLDRREELRGRLDIRLAKAVRGNVAEHDRPSAAYKAAHEILWTKPCDLQEAHRAVVAYEKAIRDELEASGE